MKNFIVLIIAALQSLCICSCAAKDAESNGVLQPTEYQEAIQYVLCAKDKTATVVKQQLPDNAISYTLKQANEEGEVNLTCAEDAGIIISDSSQQELQKIEIEMQPDDLADLIQFIDFNQDGYADITVTLGGTLNSQKKFSSGIKLQASL